MIVIENSEIKETTKLKLAIIVKEKEVLRVEEVIKRLKERKAVLRERLREATIEENNQQVERIYQQIRENKNETDREEVRRIELLKAIQRRYLRLLDLKIEKERNSSK